MGRTLSKCDAVATNDGCHSARSYFVFFRIVSGNNKTPPQARLGTSVVCCDDDGRFSLLPIRFFFCYGVLLVSRRWLGLTQHTNFSARSLSLSPAIALLLLLLLLTTVFLSQSASLRFHRTGCSTVGKIGKFSHCAFITDFALTVG